MAMFYYKLTKNNAKKNKYLTLFGLDNIRYSYEDYIKLLYDVFLYSEARTEPLKKSIKNDYIQLNKKLKYLYDEETLRHLNDNSSKNIVIYQRSFICSNTDFKSNP